MARLHDDDHCWSLNLVCLLSYASFWRILQGFAFRGVECNEAPVVVLVAPICFGPAKVTN